MIKIRLQKYLAECGVASRRKSEELILEGKVSVNGIVVRELGTKVTYKDRIEVDGKLAEKEDKKVYILLNKPVGYVSSVKDQFGRKTVLDLITDVEERVYPVGRLDYDTSGLLILSNDGDFTYKITHPKHETVKTYIALVKGVPTKEKIESFEKGMSINDYVTAPAYVKVIAGKSANATLEIVIHEGKNRQIRNMCEAIGHPVIKLRRISIGTLVLGDLKEGEWRHLSKIEINKLT